MGDRARSTYNLKSCAETNTRTTLGLRSSTMSKGAILRSLLEEIKDDPADRNLWVNLGMRIVKKKNAKYADFVNGSLILQLAAEDETPQDVEKRGEDKRGAEFWMALAKAHYNIWLKDGIMAQEDRLEKAKIACETAFSFKENVENEMVWKILISILLYSGELKLAQKSLEKMLEVFPQQANLSQILVFHSMCSFGLGKNDDAAEFLKEALFDPPRPYASYDICLLLGRVYDKCSEEDDGFEGDVVKQEVRCEAKAKARDERSESLRWLG